MAKRISDAVESAMREASITRKELAEKFGLTKAVMDQKFQQSNWDGSDLARVAEFTGASLEFTFPNRCRIPIPIEKPVRRRSKKKITKNNTEAAIPADEIDQHPNPQFTTDTTNENKLETASVDSDIPFVSEEDNIPVQEDPIIKDENDYNPPEKESNSADPTQREEMSEENASAPPQDDAMMPVVLEDSFFSGDYRPVKYQTDKTPVDSSSVGKDIYVTRSFRTKIISRAEQIINSEAPIHKDILIEKILASFNVRKAVETISATSAALSSRNRFNCNRIKKDSFFWKKNSDPEAYKVFRIGIKLERVCLYDLKNAICYALKQNTERTGNIRMDEDDLLKDVSKLFGIQRLSDNVRNDLATAVEFSRVVNAIEGKGQIYLKESGKAQ